MRLIRNLNEELRLPAGCYGGLFVEDSASTIQSQPSPEYAVAWGYGYKACLYGKGWESENTDDAGVLWFPLIEYAEESISQARISGRRPQPFGHSNTNDRETIIRRIKMLLNHAMGDGTTPDEANTARLKARDLLKTHRISMDEVLGGGEKRQRREAESSATTSKSDIADAPGSRAGPARTLVTIR